MQLGHLPHVLDHRASLEDLRALRPQAIVLSPGPGRPDRPADFGLCADVIAGLDLPLLGVCLGHQGLGVFSGAQLQNAPTVMHGYRSRIYHDDDVLMHGVPQGAFAVRYHSLCITNLSPALARIAWSDDDVVMGLRVRGRPRWGVQFHPESILTQFGERLAINFLREASSANRLECSPVIEARQPRDEFVVSTRPVVCSRSLSSCPDPEHVFRHVFRTDDAFWFDGAVDTRARYSYMGHLGEALSFRELTQRVSPPGSVEHYGDGFNAPFAGGWVCVLAYEALAEDAAGNNGDTSLIRSVRRWIAWDHEAAQVALFALADDDAERVRAEAWFDEMSARLETLPVPSQAVISRQPCAEPVEVPLSCSDDVYRQRVMRAKEALVAGESYELCLTDRTSFEIEDDPLDYYLRLRTHNPAPYAAFIRDGARAVASASPELFLQVDGTGRCTARPIKGTAPRSEHLSTDQAHAAKLRMPRFVAENLMIVDLLRNDLGRVSLLGSIQVPRLMEVETHPNVHQLVSTIEGQLQPGLDLTDVLRAAFPGGSMTGAPKRRSMEILADLEGQKRGLYSGALGYVGVDGQAMLSIVIRTAVFDGKQATAGTGGAIVMASQPDDELREAKLKVRPLLACRTPQS